MRLVLTHPYCWPEVRRGTERNVDIMLRYLARRGHDVTLVSTRNGGAGVEKACSTTKIFGPRLWSPLMGKMRIQPQHTFFLTALRELRRLSADAVHAFFYSDSLAASMLRRKNPWRSILQLNGIALPGISCYRMPPEGWMIRTAIERADEFIVCSRFIQELAMEHFGRKPIVLSPPLEMENWPCGNGPPDGRPTLLAVADFEVRRKGVRVLVRAFDKVKRELPSAVLRLSGRISAQTISEITAPLPDAAKRDIEFLGLGMTTDLPCLYQEASIMVLPSMWEPSGGAVFEALASGTPVVATRHGGLPEGLTPETGVLFDPKTEGEETSNVDGLTEAILSALRLSSQSGIRQKCRDHAARYSTDVLGPILEEIYARS